MIILPKEIICGEMYNHVIEIERAKKEKQR